MKKLCTAVYIMLTTVALLSAPTANEDFVIEADARTYTNAVAAAKSYTDAQIAAIPSPDLSPATNYTDSVATTLRGEIAAATPEDYTTVKSNATVAAEAVAGLGDLAWIDSLEWSAILNRPTTWAWSNITGKPTTWSWSNISDKPSWIGSTKPSYTLNEICPNSENWLGVPGTTAGGKSIKVLAKTVNGVIEGGMTVTGSSNNDNNTTKYRYAGVTVTRNGTATDYLFDTSSQSGIVRRSELTSATDSLATNLVQTVINSSLFNLTYDAQYQVTWQKVAEGGAFYEKCYTNINMIGVSP